MLDVGCGNGATTLGTRPAGRGEGGVVGIDLSAAMLAKGRAAAAAEGLTNIEFVHGDAQVFPFESGTFDVAISRFGVMFFADPVAAFANIARSLTAQGRIALDRVEAARRQRVVLRDRPHARGRATSRSSDRRARRARSGSPIRTSCAARSTAAGFSDVTFDTVDAPYYAGADANDAYDYVRGLGFARGSSSRTCNRSTRTARSTRPARNHRRGTRGRTA